jgi:hypothetical protein
MTKRNRRHRSAREWGMKPAPAFVSNDEPTRAEIDAIEDDLAVALIEARPVDVSDAAAFPNIAEATEHARSLQQ